MTELQQATLWRAVSLVFLYLQSRAAVLCVFAPVICNTEKASGIVLQNELLRQHQVRQWHRDIRAGAEGHSRPRIQNIERGAPQNAETSPTDGVHREVTVMRELVTLHRVQHAKQQLPGASVG